MAGGCCRIAGRARRPFSLTSYDTAMMSGEDDGRSGERKLSEKLRRETGEPVRAVRARVRKEAGVVRQD